MGKKDKKNINEFIIDIHDVETSAGEGEETQCGAAEGLPDEAPKTEEPKTPNYEEMYNQAQDRYQRSLAEFDNFRKRTIKEMSARYEDGVRSVAEKLLPIIDNFERALAANESKEDNFYQGIALIARQFENTLAELGITPIEEEPGTPFDHNLHHAVAHTEDENFGQNVITEVLQKGYKHKDRIIRPSMVKVAN